MKLRGQASALREPVRRAKHWTCPPACDNIRSTEGDFTRRIDVIALLKAIPLGIFLTVLVCLFIGSAGSTGGFLYIRHVHINIAELSLNFWMYWSWTMFLIGTGLAWAILFMMD